MGSFHDCGTAVNGLLHSAYSRMRDETSPVRVKVRSSRADSRLAGEIKALLAGGDTATARERFEELVKRHQRRAARIAYFYLRDPADVDEAVQDAFLKAFIHLPSFREELFFELWFTRIVVNGCLDRLKARARRARWLLPTGAGSDARDGQQEPIDRLPTAGPSPEVRLLVKERRAHLARAIGRLPERQRMVILLSQFEGHTTREVATMLGLNEATVRVHLFRAIRSLRRLLRGEPWVTRREAPVREAI